MSNGLCYSTAAQGKNLEIVKDVPKNFSTDRKSTRLNSSHRP